MNNQTKIVAKSKSGVFVMEYNETTNRFRLVNTILKTQTDWAVYTQIAILNGMVACTTYFAEKNSVLTCIEFCKMIGIGPK